MEIKLNEELIQKNKEIQKKFEKLPYNFYLYDSWKGLCFKLNKDIFAVKAQNNVFIIDDREKTQKLWKEFKYFVKNTSRYKPLQNNPEISTGIVIDEYWKNSFKNLFIKLPDPDSTIDYLIEIFKNNGYNIKEKV